MHQGMPTKYQFSNIAPGLSVEMFEEHWKLYEAYVLRLNEVLQQLSNPYDAELAKSEGTAGGKLRELQISKSFLFNAIYLHELFFENLIMPKGSGPMVPGPQFLTLLQNDYPQVRPGDFWDIVVKPVAKVARGWCIVGFNVLGARLDVCMLDSSADVVPLGLYPLLVIDMEEHAYAHQYGIDRGTYLEYLRRSVNWAIVEHRVATIQSASELMRVSMPEEAEEYIRDQFSNQEESFGFPKDEDWFPNPAEPQATGLDNRNQLSNQPNPRAYSSTDVVTLADLGEAFNRIKHLSVISFKTKEDLYDVEVRGKSARFREQLWSMMQEVE